MKYLLNCLVLFFGSTAAIATEQTDAEKQAMRIVALAPHIVESLYEVGAGEQIIGTTDHADYPEAAKDIPLVGNYARLQIERIVQLSPDVVIAWKTGNPAEDLDRLEKYNIPVVYSTPVSLEDVAAELRQFGKLTGREQQAEQAAHQYLSKLNALRARFADKAKITTFYELWPRPLRTIANKAWPQQQLDVCGAQNPFASLSEDYPQIGLEQVLLSQPQIIIQPSQHAAEPPDSIEWEKWQDIPAIKHNFVLRPNADKVHRMTTRMLDELIILCENIDRARQFYSKKL